MKNPLPFLLLFPVLLGGACPAAVFAPGNLVVLRVGDGSSTLVNSQGPVSVLEFDAAGSVQQTVAVSTNPANGLQISGTATSEGQLVLAANQQSLTIAGYVPPFTGTGSLSSRSAANAPRGFVTVGTDGIVSGITTLAGLYSSQNIRSGLQAGGQFWFTGSGTTAGTGLMSFDGTNAAQVLGINSRVVQANGGDLYYSTGSGTQGIYRFAGLPTGAAVPGAFLTGLAGQGTSPYDFVFHPSGNALYVADDGIGVQKFVFDGSNWSHAYNFTSAATSNRGYGLAVDFSGTDPVVYWTTPTDVYKATDLGVAAAGSSVLSAGANYAFRGLEMTPVPECSAGSLVLLAAGFAVARRRRA
jgi:hypothetical protein